MDDDRKLLKRYATDGDESAFEELTRRYVNQVYSAALRQMQDRQAAEDITQMVFIKLAEKANSLPDDVVLAGWLHTDTRFSALKVLRKERRRLAREALEMDAEESQSCWNDLRPVIDEVLGELPAEDRDAVLLRFFADRSFADVGLALRLSPDAARMRVNRALERLRDLLKRRGVSITGAALGAALLSNSVQAAPAGTVAKIISSAANITLHSGKAISKGFVISKGKMAAVGAIVVALFLGLVMFRSSPDSPVRRQGSPPVNSTERSALVGSVAASAKLTAQKGFKTLRLKVIAEGTGSPLAGVKVDVRAFTDLMGSSSSSLETDANGVGEVIYPTIHQRDFLHELHLSRSGFVPRYVSWSAFQKDEMQSIPDEYTATMPEGTLIGGFVRSESGEPIEGVKLVFSGPSTAGSPPRERDAVMGDYHTESTDAAGKWTCNHMRSEFQSTRFRLEHPLFRIVNYGCVETSDPVNEIILLPQKDYRAGVAEMHMKPGLQISGVVFEKGSGPIASAKITQDREWRRESARLTTDEMGRFKFQNGSEGKLMLTVQAVGFAPETRELKVTGDTENLRFELTRSVGFKGRILDSNGGAIRLVSIESDRDSKFRYYSDWTTHADDFGGFSWDSSPNDPFSISISACGFASTNVMVQPGSEEQLITLASAPVSQFIFVRGKVIDSTTTKPVEGFEVYLKDGAFGDVWNKIGDEQTNEFAIKLQKNSAYEIEVRAKGYETARSPRFILEREIAPFEFDLKEAGDITGLVLSPEGNPLAGVEVALNVTEKQIILGKRKFLFTDNSEIVRTDAKGVFRHRPGNAQRIYAVHDLGYAEASLSELKAGPVRLQSWSRMEGTMTFAGEPARNTELSIQEAFWYGTEESIHLYGFAASTDDSGRFTFEDLPPMEVRLSWLRSSGVNSKSCTHPISIKLESGKTVDVLYSLQGARIFGRFAWSGSEKMVWPEQIRGSLSPKIPSKPWENTPGYRDASADEKQKIEHDFPFTEAGRDYMRLQRNISIVVNGDGSFEIPYIPSGDYTLRVFCSEKGGAHGLPGKMIAMLSQEVNVSNGTEEINLGELAIKPNMRINVSNR